VDFRHLSPVLLMAMIGTLLYIGIAKGFFLHMLAGFLAIGFSGWIAAKLFK